MVADAQSSNVLSELSSFTNAFASTFGCPLCARHHAGCEHESVSLSEFGSLGLSLMALGRLRQSEALRVSQYLHRPPHQLLTTMTRCQYKPQEFLSQ